MMQIITKIDPNFKQKIQKLISQNEELDSKIEQDVAKIINSVQENGDEFIIEICNRFDGSNFKKSDDLLVTQEEIEQALKNCDKALISALKLAFKRIKNYHKKQLPKSFVIKDNLGVKLGNRWQAIESICVYAPGGTAIYPSSILMSAVPAIVAGVENIVATIPSKKGIIDPSVIAACHICGIKKIYKIGGAAAIAAFAYGTKTINKVNKIVGPGNSYVALAKKQLFGVVGIDMIAGPTDILVISDGDVDSSWIAADMLSQLEHGVDSKAILITDNEKFADEILKDIEILAKSLPRYNIISESLKKSAIIIVDNLNEEAPLIANQIAPEHLEIVTKKPELIANKIKNAGAIFLGKYTPEAIGDYVAGPSHTLPTMGSAKFASGLSVFDFLKRISIISCDKKSFLKLQKTTSLLAKTEGLEGHSLSCEIRVKNEK